MSVTFTQLTSLSCPEICGNLSTLLSFRPTSQTHKHTHIVHFGVYIRPVVHERKREHMRTLPLPILVRTCVFHSDHRLHLVYLNAVKESFVILLWLFHCVTMDTAGQQLFSQSPQNTDKSSASQSPQWMLLQHTFLPGQNYISCRLTLQSLHCKCVWRGKSWHTRDANTLKHDTQIHKTKLGGFTQQWHRGLL